MKATVLATAVKEERTERTIFAPLSVTGEVDRFEWSEETGLYHWHGDTSYAGYTYEELDSRW